MGSLNILKTDPEFQLYFTGDVRAFIGDKNEFENPKFSGWPKFIPERAAIMSVWSRILDLLFPPRCPFCGKIQDAAGVCSKCEKALPWAESGQRERTLSGGIRCVSPLWYEDQAREGILRYKFGGASGAAEALGELLADCAAESFFGEFDCVTWVPVGRKRLRSRGYDQAYLLAEAACHRWDVRPERMLRKTEDNPAQSGLKGAAARRANVLGVYEAFNPDKISGRNILLVDDIVTTGSTLVECARVLRDAGAKDVVCITLARTRESKEIYRQEIRENT